MCHERWTFYKNLSVFGHIENLRMDNIALKTFTSNSGKISWWKFYNCLVCMNSQLITHARMQRWIWNLQLHLYQPIQLLNNKYWFMESGGVRLTWLDCNHSESKWTLYRVASAILNNKLLKGNISAVFFFYPYSVRNPFENLSDPVSFGLPVNTVNFYITGSAGRLGAW